MLEDQKRFLLNVLLIFVFLAIFCLFGSIVFAQTVTTCAVALKAVPQGPFPCSIKADWVDNSGNDPKIYNQETEMVIERRLNGGAWSVLRTLPANTITYTDATATQSASVDNVYEYRVEAANYTNALPPVRQTSGYSNIASFTIPKSVPIIIPPDAPGSLTITFQGGSGELQLGDNRTIRFKDKNGVLSLTAAGITVVHIP